MSLNVYRLDEVLLSTVNNDCKTVLFKFSSLDGINSKSILFQSSSHSFALDVKLIASRLLNKPLDETTFKDVQSIAKGEIIIQDNFIIEEELKELIDHTFTTKYIIKKAL